MPAASPRRRAATFKCQRCNQEFSRSEHLSRHFRTHTNEKPHICAICQKGFSRSDVLNRHHLAHHGPNAVDQRSAPGFRACMPCATARVKCLGSQPCQRCSVRMIDCHYRDGSFVRNQAQNTDGNGEAEHGEMDMSPQNESIPAEHAETELSLPGAWTGTRAASNVGTDTQIGHMETQQPVFMSPNDHEISSQSFNLPSQVSDHYDMPEMTAQPSTSSISRDLTFQLPNHDFNSALAGYPAVTAYDFALLSNQSIEQPQLGDYGYSAINWLSPKDLGYSEFNYESQYFDVNDFDFWAGPALQSVSEQNISGDGDLMMNQGMTPHADESPAAGVHFVTSATQDVQTVPTSTSHLESPETCSTPSRSSNYYIDGAGAREPRYGRLRGQRVNWEGNDSSPLPALDQDISSEADIEFPPSIERYLKVTNNSTTHNSARDVYQKLVDEFHKSRLGRRHVSPSEYFPSIDIFDLAKSLYFEYFHPVFPLLHKTSTMKNSKSWLIELAVAAVGISYLGTEISRKCSEAFIHLLDICLQSPVPFYTSEVTDRGVNIHAEALFETQSRILCCVGMFHSRNMTLVERAFPLRSQLVGHCLRHKFLSKTRRLYSDANQQHEDKWVDFITEESNIRAGYCIFLLDCMMAYQSDFRPQMQLEDAKASLPCEEDIWEASDAIAWHLLYSQHPDSPSLLVALECLYKRKVLDSNIGEFGRVLLIHGLYHRTWEVARYHKDTLSNWIPSVPGTRAPSPSTADPVTAWLPRNPVFSKWRNSACDCLDVLHWSGNSKVARRAGLEHPTILHLHLARLILLTPGATIQSLASLIMQSVKRGMAPQESSQAQYHEDRSEVLRWFIQDQYKARLALVHAGAIFWHVRRYSHDSMLEPFAVLLATLVVWAYSTSSHAIDQQQRQGLAGTRNKEQEADGSRPQPPDKESENDPTNLPFINLDRLCDDELIQMYVLHGSRMKGFMAGIGDICKIGAPVKILREGSKIIACNGTHRARFLQHGGGDNSMAALPTWGIGVRHALFLRELADASQRRPE